MRSLVITVSLLSLLSVATSDVQAQIYYRRPVSNVWHPRSSAYLSRPTYRTQPYRFGTRYNNFNLNQIYRNSRGRFNARPSFRYNARPSFNYNARPQFRYNARPSFRYNARPQF